MTPPPSPLASPFTCDIFCRVIDNYGDIGVAWRLARQLAREHGATAKLVVDDLTRFHKLAPAVIPGLPKQLIEGVAVVLWRDPLSLLDVSDLVIEAFGCELPAPYLEQMARRKTRPVWVNLEYLSAESWVAEHHLLPSPHPTLPLTKFFFFPGFTPRTGGLIREKKLIATRNRNAMARDGTKLRVLIFGYDRAPLEALFASMARAKMRVSCGVSDGKLSIRLKRWRGAQGKNSPRAAPNMEFHDVPFVPQSEFDALLWRYDVLFVRGEDSFVRAQWAAKPFVWHIYPQSGGTHLVKLDAFLAIYCVGLPAPAEKAVRELWQAWNVPQPEAVGPAWKAFIAQLPALNAHAARWSQYLAEMPDLASNLLSFYRKNVKI